jgi:hypothetical protein
MHGLGESDGPIVPEKRANKAGPKAAAELVEGRGPAKGNVPPTVLAPDTVPGKRGIGWWSARQAGERLPARPPIVITRGKSRMR